MANTIKLRRSATSGAIPTTAQLALGELAMNTYDGKLFLKTDQSGTEAIVEVGSGSSVTISSTTPSSPNVGDIYWDSDESSAYIYYDDGDTQQWVPLVATAPVSFDTSAIVSGTLPVSRGGTGTTSYDAGKIVEGDTEAEVVDTGSDGHFKVTTEGTERLRVDSTKLDVDVDLDLNGQYLANTTAVTAVDANGKHIIDCSSGNYFTKAISANAEFVFNNVPSTGVYSFTIEIEVTGTATIAWPSSVKFNGDTAPGLTADRTHLFMFVTDDGGTRFRASALVDYVD